MDLIESGARMPRFPNDFPTYKVLRGDAKFLPTSFPSADFLEPAWIPGCRLSYLICLRCKKNVATKGMPITTLLAPASYEIWGPMFGPDCGTNKKYFKI